MPFPEHIELFDSGAGDVSTREDGKLQREQTYRWLVPNMASYDKAEEKALQLAPLDHNERRRRHLGIRSLGGKWYEIEAKYESTIVEDTDEGDEGQDGAASSISFDTTGGTEHVTQVYQGAARAQGSFTGIKGQLGHARPGQGALVPDLEGAINVEGDEVKGVDKVVPVFNFSETWVFPAQLLVTSYISTLYGLTGTVNRLPWRVFGAGEVLFLGARGEVTRGASAGSLTFNFAARPNSGTFKVGEIEVTGGKLGWEQMSVMYETAANAGTILRRPRFVFINTIYEAADFSSLGIGSNFPQIYRPAA